MYGAPAAALYAEASGGYDLLCASYAVARQLYPGVGPVRRYRLIPSVGFADSSPFKVRGAWVRRQPSQCAARFARA